MPQHTRGVWEMASHASRETPWCPSQEQKTTNPTVVNPWLSNGAKVSIVNKHLHAADAHCFVVIPVYVHIKSRRWPRCTHTHQSRKIEHDKWAIRDPKSGGMSDEADQHDRPSARPDCFVFTLERRPSLANTRCSEWLHVEGATSRKDMLATVGLMVWVWQARFPETDNWDLK